MFGAVLEDFSTFKALQEAAASSYAVLDATLAEMKHSQESDHDVATLGGLVWSTVHGMASLVINVPTAIVSSGADDAPRQAVKSTKEYASAPENSVSGRNALMRCILISV